VQTGQRKSFDQYLIRKSSSQNGKAEQVISNGSGQSKQSTGSRSNKEIRNAPERGAVSKTESTSDSAKSDTSKSISANGHNDTSEDKSTLPSADSLNTSDSLSPNKGLDSEEVPPMPARQDETTQEKSSTSTSKALDRAVSGFLEQVRAFSRASTNSGGESSEQQHPVKRRRPVLGRVNSLSSTRTGPTTKRMSRASSIDTLNEDGYGSAVDSVEPDSNNNRNSSSKHASNTSNRGPGQSFNSILSGGGGKINVYVDSPLYQDEDQGADGDEPPLTQLNYEDPDALAMREEFMKRGRSNTDNNGNTDSAKQEQGMVLGEIPELEDLDGGWRTGKRTRRAGKPKESDDNVF
jgi:DNA replication regulator DPB11